MVRDGGGGGENSELNLFTDKRYGVHWVRPMVELPSSHHT